MRGCATVTGIVAMGCNASKGIFGAMQPVAVKLEGEALDKRRAQLRDSWAKVEANIDENGAKFFLHVFKIAPAALAIFPFRDDPVLEKSPGLRGHGRMVFRTIGRLVAAQEDMSKVMPELEAVGRAHAKYSVTAEVFDTMQQALIFTLKDVLGDAWNSELEEAWTELYQNLSRDIIQVHVKNAKSHVQVEEPGDESAQNDAILIRKSWSHVSPDLKANGAKFFLKVFQVAPPALQVFPFKDDADLANSPGLHAHGRMVFNTIGRIVNCLHDRRAIIPELQSIGKAHSKYAVSAAVFEVMKQALLDTLKEVVGKGWDDETNEAWSRVYDWMSHEIIGGEAAARNAAA